MTNTTRAVVASLLVLGVAACGKSKDGDKGGSKAIEGVAAKDFVACDGPTLTKLSEDIDKANCVNVDLTKKEITDACEVTKKEIAGKRFSFKGCTFSSQGNDEVSFGAAGTDKTVHCVMKGGEAGVTEFRHAAMKFDMKKLQIDVSGVIAPHSMNGDKAFERLQMTDCQMIAHE
jgi:hypothetical protein